MKKQAFNPYLPSWEYVPDGEPYVFDGRVYVYGSHDLYNGQAFCLGDYVGWSAPIDDLGNWRYEGITYPRMADPANDGRMVLYAPDVTIGPDGRYYMYYSANEHLYVAVANSPLGPFRQQGTRMMQSLLGDEKCIDSSVFFDDDGSAWLFFVRFTDGNCIWRCRLENDLMTPVAGTLRECIHVTEPWEGRLGRVCEGPFVIKHGGQYYLTYSANDYQSQDYAVGYATAPTIDAVWTKSEKNPILHRWNGLAGCGHHSLFTDHDGQLRIVFHSHQSHSEIHPRQMHIATATFIQGRLTIGNQ